MILNIICHACGMQHQIETEFFYSPVSFRKADGKVIYAAACDDCAAQKKQGAAYRALCDGPESFKAFALQNWSDEARRQIPSLA